MSRLCSAHWYSLGTSPVRNTECCEAGTAGCWEGMGSQGGTAVVKTSQSFLDPSLCLLHCVFLWSIIYPSINVAVPPVHPDVVHADPHLYAHWASHTAQGTRSETHLVDTALLHALLISIALAVNPLADQEAHVGRSGMQLAGERRHVSCQQRTIAKEEELTCPAPSLVQIVPPLCSSHRKPFCWSTPWLTQSKHWPVPFDFPKKPVWYISECSIAEEARTPLGLIAPSGQPSILPQMGQSVEGLRGCFMPNVGLKAEHSRAPRVVFPATRSHLPYQGRGVQCSAWHIGRLTSQVFQCRHRLQHLWENLSEPQWVWLLVCSLEWL